MALEAYKTTQVAAEVAGLPTDAISAQARLSLFYVDLPAARITATGDANSTADLIILPPGKWRFVAALSKVYTGVFGASRTLDIGHAGWTKPDGSAQAASENALSNAIDVSAATNFSPGAQLTTNGTLEINSRTPVTFRAKCEGGTWVNTGTIFGVLAFMKSN